MFTTFESKLTSIIEEVAFTSKANSPMCVSIGTGEVT